ncbi:Hypothetical predicted protein [Octopus vulgaris]|uniref:Uncharacterized protein n=1 Tax=Octopus vulgaris TaxID=6645 RepID=A0AA36AI97_OCTVU|nr:Hypothetical predicted protein [Octopus vulgaris]
MFSSSKFMKTEIKYDKENMQSWLKEQLDFSLKPCRFELPVDSRQLEVHDDIAACDMLSYDEIIRGSGEVYHGD